MGVTIYDEEGNIIKETGPGGGHVVGRDSSSIGVVGLKSDI